MLVQRKHSIITYVEFYSSLNKDYAFKRKMENILVVDVFQRV